MNSNAVFSSHRIARLVSHCGEGEILWDIGCDHGLAGLSAGKTGAFKHVCFVDPSSFVIEKLIKHIAADIPKDWNYTIMKLKGDQIKVLSEKNVFLMAGFGGRPIIESVEAIRKQLKAPARFVLSPHKNTLAVREYLHRGEWHLISEEIVEEAGQFYEILQLESRRGNPVTLFGTDQWKAPAGERRREDLLKKLPLHRNAQDQAFCKHLLTLQNPTITP
jgi:tRNA (adenine22-N1)-methyltransferase